MPGAAQQDGPTSIAGYAIEGVLGEGGSAIVYAATRDGRAVALKVPRAAALTVREQARFLSEAEMLRRVEHPSIARVFDAGCCEDGTPYLAMQQLSGVTLAGRITDRPLPLAQALELFEQIVDATAALHDAGLVHRDLKPENVMLVDDERRAVLIDFGIAKDADAPASTTTQAGVARGTPATMAPERFFGAAATVSSDVYELSVLLYAMVTGRLPWSDVTNVEARLNPQPPGDGVPAALATVILRALSTRPERRPRTARELLAAAKRAAAGAEDGGRVTAETTVAPLPPELEAAPASSPLESATSDGAQVLDGPGGTALPAVRARGPLLAAAALFGGLVIGLGTTQLMTGRPVLLERALGAVDLKVGARAPLAAPELPPAAQPAAEDEPTPAARATTPRSAPRADATTSAPPPPRGKPRGAPCVRSSECASMLCAAEICQ